MGNQASQFSRAEYDALMADMKRGPEKMATSNRNTKVVAEFLDAFNRRNENAIRKVATVDAEFCFHGAERGMPFDFFLNGLHDVQQSFPDVCVTYDAIDEVEDGIVRVDNFHSRGTHTGVPFGFGPYPAIPRTDIVVEESADWTVLVTKGKIFKLIVKPPQGELVGPPAYYQKIGGQLTLEE
eukprot:Nitzschia sp. Nitz4//scaffold262_size27079//10152//10697//NITZ4_008220-RA/size27079-processed-gene-0.7-mRNA-1//-1//CDS//3329544751//5853//frame0